MGISLSCPGADYESLDDGFDSVVVRSISFNDDDVRTTVRSVSFNGRDSESTILKSLSSRKMIIEGSVSFRRKEMETTISITSPSTTDTEKKVYTRSVSFKSRETVSLPPKSDNSANKTIQSPLPDTGIPRHAAALKLQKVYKSFRTRRKLADCAVLVEQRWWKLLDFAELKRSSISFFDIEKPESAVSRWSRARTRVAKVGKGLSKDDNAQKLAFQHWLEAIDPRHRYGHNLHFYYVTWLRCKSRQPFFYWLDIGEGKEVNLVDRCPRSILQKQCIKYLDPTERKEYEVVVVDGLLLYKETGELLNTYEGSKNTKWIFVLSTSKNLYVGQKKKGKFQHSSFLAGGATSAAGRLVVEDGVLKAVWPHSGHYRPTEENFLEFVAFLTDRNVDLTNVKRSPIDEDEQMSSKHGTNIGLSSKPSMGDLMQDFDSLQTEDTISHKHLTEENNTESGVPNKKRSLIFSKKLPTLEIPKRDDMIEIFQTDGLSIGPIDSSMMRTPTSDSNTAETSTGLEVNDDGNDYNVCKTNLFDEDQEDEQEEIVPKESILQRINSKKGMKSYQLGKQLSFKWTTGAGPRIGCVRDYPPELQFHALEKMNLSPRSTMALSSSASVPTNFWRETTANNVSTPPTSCLQKTTTTMNASYR
ncbi:hypothetical protein GIB67_019743 [Kingdonia uniflora]|uniref:Uncharacterized protein n=1 Tax=Kingdonia uniflora TaxID=39325 RepID=A0A7J7MK21_9MAGN|nr:hypothetical protein GIB67_019743 [Kingdonia uniflora]